MSPVSRRPICKDVRRLLATAAVVCLTLACPAFAQAPTPAAQPVEANAASLDQLMVLNSQAMRLLSQGRYAEAEPIFRRALTLAEKTWGPDNYDTGSLLNNIAESLLDQGRYAEAEPLYRRALAIREKALGPYDPGTATSLNNLATLLQDQGRYAEAEPLFRRALAIQEKSSGPDDPNTGLSLNNLAVLLQVEGRYAEAEPLFRRAVTLAENVIGSDHPDTATSLNNLGTTLEEQGRYAEAEPLFRRALAIYEKALGFGHPLTAQSLNNLAAVLQDEGRYAEAEPLYRRALAIREKTLGPDHPGTAESLNNLADVLSDQVRYAEAEPLDRRALAIYRKALGTEHPATATSLENLGDVAVLQGQFQQAVEAFRPACRVRARAASGVQASRAMKDAAGSSSNSCSETLARALWGWSTNGGGTAEQDQSHALRAEAFTTAQSSTASSAGEALARAAARETAAKSGAGGEAVEYEADLDQLNNLNDAFAEAAGSASTEQQQTLGRARDETLARISALEAILKSKAPRYWDYRSPQPVDVVALQATSGDDAKLLHANEAVVLWMVAPGKAKGLVFAVSKTDFAWADIGLTGDQVKADVDTLRYKIDPISFGRGPAQDRGESAEPFDRGAAHELYVALLGDSKIQAVINDAGIDTLIIVPTGPLTSLPPGLLAVNAPTLQDRDPGALAEMHWLIEDKAIAVLPTVSSLRTLRQLLPASRPDTDLKLRAFADPDFQGTGKIPELAAGETAPQSMVLASASHFQSDGRGAQTLRTLAPLYGTLSEGRKLSDILDPGDASALLLGPQASKTNLLRMADHGELARVQVLDFSTHGLLTGELNVVEPALVLAAPPATGADPRDDGLLKASDAAALTLNADWVVLSACNTAAGDGNGADGLSGLARAFFHAGASTLLVSHWRVDDNATEQLITDTFKNQKDGQPKAKALQMAMVKMIRHDPTHKYVDPRFWAPFVIVGEPE